MTRVTATEFKNNIGRFSDAAMTNPVIVTSHQRDRLVLMSADEYRRLTNDQNGLSNADKARLSRVLDRHDETLKGLSQR